MLLQHLREKASLLYFSKLAVELKVILVIYISQKYTRKEKVLISLGFSIKSILIIKPWLCKINF